MDYTIQQKVSRIWYSMVMASVIATACHSATFADQGGKYNVLFIAVDDLRTELGCSGTPIIKSPNIDALAQTGIVFSRAYCQQAICGPSRTSMLTGLRPDTTKVCDQNSHFRQQVPSHVTLPQYFKEHGYHTQSLGKIYHGPLDDPQSWVVPAWHAQGQMYGKPETLAAIEEKNERLQAEGKLRKMEAERDPKTGAVLKYQIKGGVGATAKGPAWEDPDVPDNALRDGMIADKAINVLGEVKDNPFFLAVGFHRPHLPFVSPKKYYDLYTPQDLQLASNPDSPKDAPPIALEDSIELRLFYSGIPKKGTPVPDETARKLIHGYYAAVSYVDAQIGRVLAELDRLGLRERTVIVIWGDHGWHLGDHGIWGKSHNFEVTTRAPLIFSVPGQAERGVATDALVEFVDIYPTLADLCGLPVPEGLEGISMVPVINEPDRPWKKAAFSQYPRGVGVNRVMGRSMRTDRYRYTEWNRSGKPPAGVELYDHKQDPDENVNLAGHPEYKDLIAQLSKQLHAGWREAIAEESTAVH